MVNSTPGPWKLCYDGQIDGADGATVVRFPWESYKEFSDQTEANKANARLIAAAPELLEALKYARRMVRASECDIAFIDAAIAKAIGVAP